jgi:hypothetical protein
VQYESKPEAAKPAGGQHDAMQEAKAKRSHRKRKRH